MGSDSGAPARDDADDAADSGPGIDDVADDGDDVSDDVSDDGAGEEDEDVDADDAGEVTDDSSMSDEVDAGSDPGDGEPADDDPVAATDDATDEASSDEAAMDDATDEAATDDATDEAATDDATDEMATDDATDEMATDDATDEIATEDDPEDTALPVIEQAVPNDPARAAAGRLLLQVTAANLNAVPGARNLLFIAVGNTSNEAVEGVTAVFTVPPGMQFNGAGDAHPDASCYLNNCAPGVEATWNLGALGAGETRTLEVNVLVDQTATDASNIAAHVVVNAPGQSTLVVDKSFPVTTAAREAELALTSEADPLLPGQSTDLHVDIGQIGDLPLQDAVVKLALPRGVSVLGALANGGVQEEGGVTWTLGDLAIGASLKRTVRVMVDDSASPGNVYNPTATLTFTTERAVTEVSQLPISVVEEHAPLTLKVAAEQAPGSASGRLRYFATVSNTGLRTVPATSLWFRQPVESASNGVADAVPDQSCYLNGCSSGVEAIWPLGDVQPGETLFFEVNPAIHATVTDGSLVSTYFALFPAQGGHVRSSMTVPVNAKAAAEHHLGASKTPVVPGDTFSYTLHVGQVGAASLQNAKLALQLPAGLTAKSISDGGVDEGGGNIVWDVGTVAVAAHAKRSVEVTVGADFPVATVLEARSVLRYDGGAEVDAASEDLVAVVEALPPLAMTLQIIPEGQTTAPADPVGVPGGRVLVRTTVTNTSARPIEGATLVLRMPKAMAFNGVADATPDASCYLNNCAAFVESVFPLGTLAAGQALIVDTNTTVSAVALPGSLMALTPRVYGTGVTQHAMLQSVVPIGN